MTSNASNAKSEKSSKRSRDKFRKVIQAPFLLMIKFYQVCISPLLPNCCRFEPSCSVYATEAIKKHGVIKGCFLAAKRILRCHPWGGSGYDPVP